MRAFKVAAATVGLSAALTGTAVGLAGPVNAAPGTGCTQGAYPPASSTVALSRSRATVGMEISYRARCFKPGEQVTVTLYSTPQVLGTRTATSTGEVSGTFTVPSNLQPGSHTLELAAATGTQSASLTVVPSAATTGSASNDDDSLAFTGSDAAKTVGTGAVLLLGGGALIMAARRRKTASATA